MRALGVAILLISSDLFVFRIGGLGLHLIRRSVDAMDYETNRESGNRLTLVKTTPLAKLSLPTE